MNLLSPKAVSLRWQRPLAAWMAAFLLLAAGAAFADPPVASNVSISGNLQVGQTLSGEYDYSDVDGDNEANSQFQWYSSPLCFQTIGVSPIGGATNQQYTLTGNEEGECVIFQVTPISEDTVDDDEVGVAVRSVVSTQVQPEPNIAPQITGQDSLDTDEDESLTLTVDDFDIDDPDDNDFTLTVQNGSNYSVNGNTITPAQNFNGNLTVPVQVSDGQASSSVFNASVTVNEVNDPPQITGQDALTMNENTSLTLTANDFDISDPDDNSFTLEVDNGSNYSVNGNTITPNSNFSGTLTVPVRVNDGDDDSNTFNASVTVNDVNVAPVASNVSVSPNNNVEVGDMLTGSYDYSDADGDLQGSSQLQWLRNGTPIGGANSSQYTLTGADEGAQIRFRVTPVAQTGVSPGTAVESSPVGPVQPANSPPVASNVTISGAPQSGQTLTGDYDYSDADGDDEGASQYQWLRDGSPIGGATSLTYELRSQDEGTQIRFRVTPVAATGASPGNPVLSAPLDIPVNQPPEARNVSISVQGGGQAAVGKTLAGNYNFFDADGDDEGDSTFRWFRNNNPINGATNRQYTLVEADKGEELSFEVTPVAETGASPGDAVRSSVINVINQRPEITGQVGDLVTDEDTSLTLTVDDFTIEDADSELDDISLIVLDGENYTRNGTTITPDQDYFGALTVEVRARDEDGTSDIFDATVTVNPINDAPEIVGQNPDPITTPEDTSVTIMLTNLVIDDPDNDSGFVLALQAGDNYTVAGNVVTPSENFDETLRVPATVTDTEGAESPVFEIEIAVGPVNDGPELVEPIPDSTAIENSPFTLDVSGNFTDAEGDPLRFEATGQPPVIAFDPDTGVFSGTLSIEDIESLDPVYTVTVRAFDPDNAFTSDQFDLTLSALDRANLALDIAVTPDTGEPGEEFLWTFTTLNPVGPQPGATVELTGTFTGAGVTITPAAGAVCTISQGGAETSSFSCTVGAVPVGETAEVQLRTTVSQVTEVLVTATSASANSLPIDPNLEDNSESRAIGVGDAFSMGAAEAVGSSDVLAVAAGDINGDGRSDIVVGTANGQPVQVFLADEPRETCNCYRDYVGEPISLAVNGQSNGIALADFDNNGTLDVAVATGGGEPDAVFSNDGAGNFSLMATLNAVATFGRAIAAGDFNNDGNADIAVAALGGNPVWLGDGAGAFSLETTLGDADGQDVAVADFNGDNLDDLVFANDGESRAWLRLAGGGFAPGPLLSPGSNSSVAAGDLNGDGQPDIVFGREAALGGVPSNPLYFNDGAGDFGVAALTLGISPTEDVAVGDINMDGAADIVFVNQSGVHQVWLQAGGDFALAPEQIIDLGAVAVAIGNFGDVAESEPGGNDIVLAGSPGTGIGIYLNDGAGNLGRGDTEPPELTLVGEYAISIPAGGTLTDPGATALDNIDGDISDTIVVDSNVNAAIVGTYSLTYSVADFAGNAATPLTRTVTVEPAAGTGGGGGGGGTWSPLFLAALSAFLFLVWLSGPDTRQFARMAPRSRNYK